MSTSAKMIADSISPDGVRLSTIECVLWRPILAELNTHRAFSRNSASSRARSVKKTFQDVLDDPAFPIVFPREHVGMSGGEALEDNELALARAAWWQARDGALAAAQKLVYLGVHKSIVNRLIEPFMWHTVVITATEWDNFLEQRLALLDDGRKGSDPMMYELAVAVKQALAESTPTWVDYGDWHLPYITQDDVTRMAEQTTPLSVTQLCQVSVARCAGVSYLTQDKADRDFANDIRIYNKLLSAKPPHWSPFEHVATPAPTRTMRPPRRYNLTGWKSLRWMNDVERPLV